MTGRIRELAIGDHADVLTLWRASEGMVLRTADERESIRRYLARNPGLSFVYEARGTIVGAVLCGTDGRRGYLQHLAVAASHRRQGIGRALASACIDALRGEGIGKCHLMVVPTNTAARSFWRRLGWSERSDVLLMSYTSTDDANA